MPITPLLKSEKFDSEASRVMGVALEMPCLPLPTGDCANDVKHATANTIIVPTQAVSAIPCTQRTGLKDIRTERAYMASRISLPA